MEQTLTEITIWLLSTSVLIISATMWLDRRKKKLSEDFNYSLAKLEAAIVKEVAANSQVVELTDRVKLKILQTASCPYLTERIPDNWHDLTEEEQNDYLVDHAWEPLNEYDADRIWENIDQTYDRIIDLLLELNKIHDVQKKEQPEAESEMYI